MLGELIRLLIAAACGLFVLSLPISKTGAGATLRRAAGVCIVLAFLPSLLVGLFSAQTATSPVESTGGPAATFFTKLGCLTAVVILSIVAYWILQWRSRRRAAAKPRDPWESFFDRGGGKRPFTMNPNASRTRGPFWSYDDDGED